MRIGKRKKRQRNPKRILKPDELPIKMPERIAVDIPLPVQVPVPKEVNIGGH